MRMEPHIRSRMISNALLSVAIYALPPFLMLLTLYARGSRPWDHSANLSASAVVAHHAAVDRFHGYGFMFFIIALGLIEVAFGLYGPEWNRNEKSLDLAC